MTDVDPDARRPGARVHFDARELDGVRVAANVSLRQGTRVSRRQRGFGSLTGARQPGTKGPAPFAELNPELVSTYVGHPIEIVRQWADDLAGGEIDAAMSLYAPDATVYVRDARLSGRRVVRAVLEQHLIRGFPRRARVRGVGADFEATWEPLDPGERGLAVLSRIDHGLIREQWMSDLSLAGRAPRAETPFPIDMVVRGPVEQEAVAYARERLSRLSDLREKPILFARVKLSQMSDPARVRPALCEVEIDLNGDPLRAHVAARSMREAVDLVQRRIRDKIEHRAERRERERGPADMANPGEWRHGDAPSERPEYFDRPAEDRQLLRHKTFAEEELTLDEAVFDMDQLDYDFYLFCDLATGLDSVLERLEGGSFRLTQLGEVSEELGLNVAPIIRSPIAAPSLSVEEAIDRLNLGNERFVFFGHARTGRGAVVYRRYDGHYGMVTCVTP